MKYKESYLFSGWRTIPPSQHTLINNNNKREYSITNTSRVVKWEGEGKTKNLLEVPVSDPRKVLNRSETNDIREFLFKY